MNQNDHHGIKSLGHPNSATKTASIGVATHVPLPVWWRERSENREK